MGALGGGLLSNLLASLLWLLGGILLTAFYRSYRARRQTLFNHFSQMPFGIGNVYLVYGLIEPEDIKQLCTVEEGDVSAVCSALSLLEERFGPTRVSVLNSRAAQSLFGSIDNLLSVSGPVWNPITRALLQEMRLPIRFDRDGEKDVLRDELTPARRVYETRYDGTIARECYGIVCRGSLETSANKRKKCFTVAAGISALSTYGAVTWLRKISTMQGRDDVFLGSLKKHEHAVILLRVTDQSPQGFKAYSASTPDPGFLKVDVIAQYRHG